MFGQALLALDRQAELNPDRVAFCNSAGEKITFAELATASNAIAHWICEQSGAEPGVPIMVFGHKSPYMLASILAAMKAGHAYAPVDTIYPIERVRRIASQLEGTVILDTTAGALDWGLVDDCPFVLDRAAMEKLCQEPASAQGLPGLEPDEAAYMLFTSGSTGTPKGVAMPSCYLDVFHQWLLDYFAPREGEPSERRWFNRSIFCFDLSMVDVLGGLAAGDTTFALEEEAEESLKSMFDELSRADITDWVSTPSFVDQCLADPSFNAELLPHLARLNLAGEALRKDTVLRMQERFPGVRVFNNYGPSETGTCTMVEITPEMLEAEESLPVGYLAPGLKGYILDPETLEEKPQGELGELFIVGRAVGLGYWKMDELTERGFHSCPEELVGPGERSYRTGDECFFGQDGLIYYHGRLDMQVKLHGFRIELGDIESELSRLPEVDMVCVLPVYRDGRLARLMAVIQPAASVSERGLALTRILKDKVRDILPSYMIPGTFKYVDKIELNANGKADRKKLAQVVGA